MSTVYDKPTKRENDFWREYNARMERLLTHRDEPAMMAPVKEHQDETV